jgi:hypothetical protein
LRPDVAQGLALLGGDGPDFVWIILTAWGLLQRRLISFGAFLYSNVAVRPQMSPYPL